jgi:type I restriction enzyme M protein
MNMILHDNATAEIHQGNTLADPKFKDGDSLKTFHYVVANPPFSDKRWSTGIDPSKDPHERFKSFGVPPDKQGDYAYLLHIVRSLKPSGCGACILPYGVLFRGNAEAVIRKNLIRKGYIKGIIGLPANLFYGTGIPACIIVIDKENAAARKGIFMVDASKGFIKDGNKNRLRERDLHQIVDVFTNAEEHPGYSRLVPHDEIEKNDFNLNLPRDIDTQDIGGHLHGGIPTRDIDALGDYWQLCPELRATPFSDLRPGYSQLSIVHSQLKETIHGHPQFAAFIAGLGEHFKTWRKYASVSLKELQPDCLPKQVIHDLSENLLAHAEGQPLIAPYALYPHLMDYWSTTMQDDVYLIAADGWKAVPYRIIEKNKKTGKERDKGWACDLLPKPLIVARYFANEQGTLESRQEDLETVTATFNANSGTGDYYGWMQVTLHDTGSIGTIHDWAWDNSGVAITVAAVPEVSAVGGCAFMLLGALLSRKRRRRHG